MHSSKFLCNVHYFKLWKNEEKRTQNISEYIFKQNHIQDGDILCRIMNKYLKHGLINGSDEETETKVILIPLTNKKTDKIYKTIFFFFFYKTIF